MSSSKSMASTWPEIATQAPPPDISLVCFENEKSVGGKVQGCGVRRMYLAAASCLFLALTMGLASGYTAPAIYDMTHDPRSPVKPTEFELNWISSSMLAGFVMGDLCVGLIVNRIGRREALVFNLVPAGLGWLTVAYARTAGAVIAGRLVTGLAVSTVSIAVPAYLVEVATPEVRGVLGSGFQGFLVTGHLLSVTLGSFVPWNYLALNGAVFSIAAAAIFSLMPESPRWLVARGRLGEAVRVMKYLHGDRLDAERECLAIHEDLRSKPAFSLREVANPAVWKPTLIGISIFFFVEFSGMMTIFSYSSEIFEASKDFIDPAKATIVLAAVQVAGTLASNSVVDRLGRRPLLLASGTFMSVALLAMGTYYYHQRSGGQEYIWVPLASLALYVLAYAAGYGPVSILLVNEMLPTKARGAMAGVVGVFNGLFGFVVILSFSTLEGVLGTYGAFWMFCGFATLGVVFVALVVPETKGQRLEEIENLFRRGGDSKAADQERRDPFVHPESGS